MAKGIKKFVSELNRLNEGNYQFVVVEQYSNTFSIVGAHKGDQVTFNYPGGFKWDGSSFNRINDGGIVENYYLLVE